MHLISFDASPKQLSKLRNGHKVRIKKGSGFNLVVNPSNYNLVSRAFAKNKGVQINLSPEEIDHNKNMSPEQHEELSQSIDNDLYEHLPFAEGGSIFKRISKSLQSKKGKDLRRALKPAGRAFLNAGKDIAHEQIAQLHMQGADYLPENENARIGYNELFNVGHQVVDNTGRRRQSQNYGYGIKSSHQIQPNEFANISTANYVNRNNVKPPKFLETLHKRTKIKPLRNPSSAYIQSKINAGRGLGTGMGAGMNAHEALKLANLATANANYQLAKLHNSTVHGIHASPPIKRYYDDEFSPPSRGTGLYNHHNMIRGRGSMLSADDVLPPALQSQPFGANWHMQFFLPPQYHKYNDGTDIEGRGLTAGGLYI